MATETAKYRVISTATDYEVREYAPQIVAETTVDGEFDDAANAGFRRLAGFIFGKNKGQRSIAMTSPVTQAAVAAGRGYLVRFTMPASLSRAATPEPLDANVRIVELPLRLVAAHRFSGRWSNHSFETHLATLRAAMQRDHLDALGAPEVARYDPPWTPWLMRRNEILFEVAAAHERAAGAHESGAVLLAP